MLLVQSIFETIGEAITAFISALSSGLSGVGSMFMGADNQLTFIGTLLLIVVGVAIVYWCFGLIMRLVRRV